MQTSKGAVPGMLMAASVLLVFGVSQFAGIPLSESHHEHEAGEQGEGREFADSPLDKSVLEAVAARYQGRIKEVEREGRLVEVEVVDADGREREVMVDPDTGEIVGE